MNGLVIWITGLPGSGKSCMAEGIKERFPDFVVLKMDDLRKVVTPEPTYSESEREMVYRAIIFMAHTLSDLGHPVLIDATGNMRKWRELARNMIPGFGEVYLKCPIKVCMDREHLRTDTRGAPRDIYDKAGKGWPVPGLQAPYEEPLAPELMIETDKAPMEEALSMVCEFISARNTLKP